jgi:hypothetical protein
MMMFLEQGNELSLTMQVQYAGSGKWINLPTDEWSITPDKESALSVTKSGKSCVLSSDASGGTRITCAIRYQNGTKTGMTPSLIIIVLGNALDGDY